MLQILILAFIQGLTEFLPVSSSGHLILIPYVMGWQDQGLEVDVALHAGTLGAVLIYFWRDVCAMVCGFFQDARGGFRVIQPATQLALCLVIATIPVVILGVIFKVLTTIRAPLVIVGTIMGFGVVLYLSDRRGSKQRLLKGLRWRDALFIGLAQAISLIPGVSRSGICMTAANFLGFQRQEAARFSFLLAIPAILGAVTLTAYDAYRLSHVFDWSHLGWGMLAAFIFGLTAIHGMLKFLQYYSFLPFMIYRFFVGLIIMIIFIF